MGFACDDVPKGVFPHRERVGLLEELVSVELGLSINQVAPAHHGPVLNRGTTFPGVEKIFISTDECSQLPISYTLLCLDQTISLAFLLPTSS